MQNGMMFGGEGPVMQGTWYNPTTGDVFTVRDSFFEDNNYVVTTTDGRYLNYNQLQNYIQSDTPAEQLKKSFSNKQQEILPSEVQGILEDNTYDSLILPEDLNQSASILSKPLGNINNASNSVYKVETKPLDINKTIIEKALKNTTPPQLTIIAEWDKYPEKEITMLTDIMNISRKDIADWYCENLETEWLQELLESFKNSIYNKILSAEGYATEETNKSKEEIIKNIGVEKDPDKLVERKIKKPTKKTTKSK